MNKKKPLKGFLNFRDLKRILKKIRKAADDEGIIDDLEEFVDMKLIEMLVEEITNDPMYQALIKSLLDRLKEEL